jgi:hypothetical protein
MKKPKTARELYEALSKKGFFGLWKNREDLKNISTNEFCRKLRGRTENRYNSDV